MRNRNSLLFILFLCLFSVSVLAIDQFMAFQGDALLNNAVINNGNLTVVIYTAPSGGSPIYNETFNNSINNGRFDVILGNKTENLTLDWGASKFYYTDVYIDKNKVTTTRQLFQNGIQSTFAVNSTMKSIFTDTSTAAGSYTVALGNFSTVSANYATIAGGYNNIVSGVGSFIGGGGHDGAVAFANIVSGAASVIVGGSGNNVSDTYSSIVGGESNFVSGQHAFLGGGATNNITSNFASILGGATNLVSGIYSTISGGNNVTVSGDYSFAFGRDINNPRNYAASFFSPAYPGIINVSGVVYANNFSSNSPLYLQTAGATRIFVNDTTGNVGIGTLDARTRLRVDGNLNITAGFDVCIEGGNCLSAAGGAGVWQDAGGQIQLVAGSSQLVNITNTLFVNETNPSIYMDSNNILGFNSIALGVNGIVTANGSSILGGYYNNVSANYSSIAGGYNNAASGYSSFVGGGYNNTASGPGSFVGGGGNDGIMPMANIASGDVSVITGGLGNIASGQGSFVGGGLNHISSGTYGTVAGGFLNAVYGQAAVIAGGDSNTAWTQTSTISGGYLNVIGDFIGATGLYAAIGGGFNNTINADYSVISGGEYNNITGTDSMIPGGYNNTVTGDYSFAAGRNAMANTTSCFAWGDSSTTGVGCNASDQFVVQAGGGAAIYSNSNLSAGVWLTPGGGAWASVSDRNKKENFIDIDTKEVLNKLSEMEITEWNYKSQDPSIRHISPMSQDFFGAYSLGMSNKFINSLDIDGISLAAIQGLHQIVKEQEIKINSLEERLIKLEQICQK